MLRPSKVRVVLSCIALYSQSMAQTEQSPDGEIIRVVQTYDRAWNSKDAVLIERILAPNYIYFTSKGATHSRQQMLEMSLSSKYKLTSAERTEMRVYRMSSTAVVSSRWNGSGTYDGGEFRDDQRCSIVLGREQQRWQVLMEHCTQIAGP